tara:strand:- start:398 stop:925 length:528 start_codon:yes stop_codon:yes gene_type:complete
MEKTFKSPSNDNNKDINFFGGPIPGQSLTESPGKYPWDKPPKYSDIDDAYEYVSLQIYSEEGIRKIMDLLEMGVSPRLIARSTVLVGWMNNLWNPDVAEMLKQAIAVDVTLIGTEADIDINFDIPKSNFNVDYKEMHNRRKQKLSEEMDDSVIEDVQEALKDRGSQTKKGLMSKE